MSKEELYTLALSDIHKYNLLNEIFAIRDERFSKEQQDSMLCVNGYIGIDTLNDYVNLINQLQQKENIIKEVREYIKEVEKIDNYLDGVPCIRLLEMLDKGE
jgi:hypothetical protein